MLRHLAVKFDFLRLGNIPPLPPTPSTKTGLIFLFFRQRRSHNIELEGQEYKCIRELKLDANKIEQVLQCRKVSLSKSVSITSVVHCSCNTENHFVTSLELTLVTLSLNSQLGDASRQRANQHLYREVKENYSSRKIKLRYTNCDHNFISRLVTVEQTAGK